VIGTRQLIGQKGFCNDGPCHTLPHSCRASGHKLLPAAAAHRAELIYSEIQSNNFGSVYGLDTTKVNVKIGDGGYLHSA
jgi:hypothetical protein